MKNKLIGLILFFLLLIMALTIVILFTERTERNFEIEELNQKIISSDSISKMKIEKLNSIIDRKNTLIDELNSNKEIVNGFRIGDKSISIEELLKIVNEAFTENNELRNKIKYDELIINHIEDSYGVKVVKDSLGRFYLKLKNDSTIKNYERNTTEKIDKLNTELEEKRFILEQLKKRYDLKYEVKTEGNKIKSTIYITKLDSALWLYPHYKHKIREDKNGNTYIK